MSTEDPDQRDAARHHRPAPGADRPAPGADRPATGADRPAPGADRRASGTAIAASPAAEPVDRPLHLPDRTRTIAAAAVGLVAGIVFLAVAEIVALLLNGAGSPLVAVGSAAIDLAPRWVKDLMVTLFGTGDKAALFVLMAVLLALITAAAGVLERRRPPFGTVVFGVGGVIALVAVMTRSGSGSLDGAPSVVGVLAAVVTLRLGMQRFRRWDAAAEQHATPTAASTMTGSPAVQRRAFLGWTLTLGVTALVVGAGARVVDAASSAAAAVKRAVHLPTPTVHERAVPAGASLGVHGITPYVTPNAEFYRIDTALRVPSVDPDTWKLRITGMVDHDVEISFADLLARPLEEHMATMSCVSNEVGGDLIGNALWLGYPIRHLLAEAGPHASADMVLSRSVDGFTAGTPLDVLQDAGTDAILAVGMNGEPLPAEHGFPVRMVVPGLYGYVSATKWVTELTVTRFADAEGYWTPRGWSAHGPVKLESRIDTPRSGGTVRAGERVAVAGVAWQPHTGVRGVQVRVDDGAWRDAELADSVSADTWRQWVLRDWTPTHGPHTLTVRAISADGTVQTSVERAPAPNGASGWHSVGVIAS
ncbi:molybdopterin-dependent oxidoreductase [Curtobacterium sp. MCBD17_040]|uniref:molybdopterin-dependent oxidoreductase n=1 Tax=Curtobacterium sp. MCBD17_040 TaxID=2175674 RepID=UPI0026C95D7F